MSRLPILEAIGTTLNRLPGVFSTAQWGGRAYKLPGPGGTTRKSKLLAFVASSASGEEVHVSFKLDRTRAERVVSRFGWIEPHGFRTLAPAGWVTARVSTSRQLGVLEELLTESRGLHPQADPAEEERTVRNRVDEAAARRIDRVMREAREEGWTPEADPDA